MVGIGDGCIVDRVGFNVGSIVGEVMGVIGLFVGSKVGSILGSMLGALVGSSVGAIFINIHEIGTNIHNLYHLTSRFDD